MINPKVKIISLFLLLISAFIGIYFVSKRYMGGNKRNIKENMTRNIYPELEIPEITPFNIEQIPETKEFRDTPYIASNETPEGCKRCRETHIGSTFYCPNEALPIEWKSDIMNGAILSSFITEKDPQEPNVRINNKGYYFREWDNGC